MIRFRGARRVGNRLAPTKRDGRGFSGQRIGHPLDAQRQAVFTHLEECSISHRHNAPESWRVPWGITLSADGHKYDAIILFMAIVT